MPSQTPRSALRRPSVRGSESARRSVHGSTAAMKEGWTPRSSTTCD